MDRTGGKTMAQRANEQARKIFADHHPKYISGQQAKEIDKIAKAVQKWVQA